MPLLTSKQQQQQQKIEKAKYKNVPIHPNGLCTTEKQKLQQEHAVILQISA